MKLYVAGPMTGYPNFNYDAFHRVAGALRADGHVVISPAESFGGVQTHTMSDYARFDIHALLQVEGVVLLPHWQHSDGARREIVIATWLGLPFFTWEVQGHTTPYYALEPIEPIVLLSPGIAR